MARSKEAIIETIRRLLALATSSNIGEAATAAAKAQELIERHNISEAMIQDAQDTASKGVDHNDPVTRAILYNRATLRYQGKTARGRIPTWIIQLATGIVEVNRCRIYWNSSNEMGVVIGIGTESNLNKASTLLTWLMSEIDRLFDLDKQVRGFSLGRGEGKAYGNAFRLGAASTIAVRLRQAQRDVRTKMLAGPNLDVAAYQDALQRGDSEKLLSLDNAQKEYSLVKVQTALMRLDNELTRVEAWEKENLKLRGDTSRNYRGHDDDAFVRGRQAGEHANLYGTNRQLHG